MKKFILALFLIFAMAVSGFANSCTDHVANSTNGKGDFLIYPIFYTDSGVTSRISVVNTDSVNSVVYKFVIRSHEKSIELADFLVVLSPNDTADFNIEYQSDGSVKVYSNDDSVCDFNGQCGNFSATLFSPTCDDNNWGYIEAFQGAAYSRTALGAAATGPILKSVIFKRYQADVKAGTLPGTYSNETAGKAELIFNNANEYAVYNAYAFTNYKVTAGLTATNETFIGTGANNSIGEFEAAIAKTNIEFYNFEGTIFPIITLPTKLIGTSTCVDRAPKGPFFVVNGKNPAYTVSSYDTEENTEVKAGCSVSPCPVATVSKMGGEVNIFTETTFASKGWEDFSFSQNTASTTNDGTAISYTGIPALALNLVVDQKGFAIVDPTYTPSVVTCGGTTYTNYYMGASNTSASGGGSTPAPSVPNCSGLDENTCKATAGCTASTDFFGNFDKCVLDCAQYNTENDCTAAFDGNSCSWNATFGICEVK